MSDQFAPTGMGPNRDRQEGPHAHETKFDPAGKFVFGTDLGLDRAWSWTINNGKFVQNTVPYIQVASGSGRGTWISSEWALLLHHLGDGERHQRVHV